MPARSCRPDLFQGGKLVMMTRRHFLALPAGLWCAGAFAQRTDAMLWNHFSRELGRYDQQRRERLTQVRSPSQLQDLQIHVQRTLMEGIGKFPERTPLNPKIVGTLSRPDYVIEKLIFESRPGFFVTASLYRPLVGSGRRPAVVQDCGHYQSGKAAPDYQRACIGLAKKGIVALIFDPVGQGERWMYRDDRGQPMEGSAEHNVAGRPAFLVGVTLTNYRMWDIMRAFDYLESRPEVDRTRMGLLGHSGGGMMTLLTAPLEPRVRAAMSCCAVTSFYHKFLNLLDADAEQIVPGIYPNAVDHPELIATVAPRAFLIGAVLRDFVPIVGTRRTFAETKPLFELAGVPDHLAMVESDDIHRLDRKLREACYTWMLKHLAEETGNAGEPEMEIETEENLRCMASGCVMDAPGAQSVFDMSRNLSRELARSRRTSPAAGELRALLNLPVMAPVRQSAGSIESEPGIIVPSTLWKARGANPTLLIVAAESGRQSPDVNELARAFNSAGHDVLGVDLRGWGQTTPPQPPPDPELPHPYPWDGFFTFKSFQLARPLFGMRVHDLLATVRVMAAEYRRIYLVGLDAAGLVALHAGVLDPSVAGVATYRSLVSWQEILDNPLYAEPTSSFVHEALVHYDLPDLAKSLRPRPYVAVEPYDSMRQPVGPARGPAASEILKGLQL